jgi:hypothetical protein
MEKPYRAWIDYYLTTMEPPEIERVLGSLIGELPDEIYERMPTFMDAAMKFLVGETLRWDLSGGNIIASLAGLADEHIPVTANLCAEEQGTLYGTLFDVITLFFAARAAESEELRQVMGLEK